MDTYRWDEQQSAPSSHQNQPSSGSRGQFSAVAARFDEADDLLQPLQFSNHHNHNQPSQGLSRSSSTRFAADDLGAMMDRTLNINGKASRRSHPDEPVAEQSSSSNASSSSPRLLAATFSGKVQTPLRKALRSVTSHHHSSSRSATKSGAEAISHQTPAPKPASQYPGRIPAAPVTSEPHENIQPHDLSPRKQYIAGSTSYGSLAPEIVDPREQQEKHTPNMAHQQQLEQHNMAHQQQLEQQRHEQEQRRLQQQRELDRLEEQHAQIQRQLAYEEMLESERRDSERRESERRESERRSQHEYELRQQAQEEHNRRAQEEHNRRAQEEHNRQVEEHHRQMDEHNRRAQEEHNRQIEEERRSRAEAEEQAKAMAIARAEAEEQARAHEQELQREQAEAEARARQKPVIVKKGVEDFEFKDELGSGSYSTVIAASDKQTLRQYAIKVLDKAHIIKEQKVKYVEIEKQTLNRLGDHPGIIHLYYTFQDRVSLYFVLDFAPNGELLHLIKRIGSLDETCARYYSCQLLDAIEYMHSRGVIHRDLKPENILLDYKMRIKITDFGTAKLLEPDARGNYPSNVRANSFVGTAEYVTPELLLNKYQDKSADVWAFGCVLFQMITATPPFQGSTQYKTFQRISKMQYSIPPGFPFVVRDLLRHVLVSTRARWTVDQIKEHPFFEGVEWSRKAIWEAGPPRLQPYRPSSSSMNPRNRSTHTPPATTSYQPKASSPQVVPTSSGLQPVRPATRAGMPTKHALVPPEAQGPRVPQQSPPQQHQHHQPAPPSRPKIQLKHQPRQNTSASAAAAALNKAGTTNGSAANPHSAPSGSYLQGQERINQIMRRVQEQRISGRPIQNVVPVPPKDTPSRPESPRSPTLPQPALTHIEGEWSTVLISSAERILKMGRVYVHVGSNPAATDMSGSSVRDDSLLAKLFAVKKKLRIAMVTTAGRLLITDQDKKVRAEVPLGVPQVVVRQILHGDEEALVIETYNRVLTIEDPRPGGATNWVDNIELARKYYAQATAEQERNAFSAAAAAAVAVSGVGRR